MKKTTILRKSVQLLAVILVSQIITNAQGIGINSTGANPHTSSMLDVTSTDKGILVPRMTSGQRVLIAGPADGLLVYDITTLSFWYFNGTIWINTANDGNGIYDGDGTAPAGTDVSITDFINFDNNTLYVNAGINTVGMRTNNPLQALHVADDIILGGGQGGNYDGNTEHLKIWARSKVWNVGVINDAAAANSDFFVSQTDGANDGSFTIDPNGNVGINQLAATHKLDVISTTATTDRGAVYGRVTNGTNAYGVLGYNTDDLGLGVVRVGVYGNSGTGEVAIGGRYSGTKFGYIGSTTYGLYAEHSVWAGHFQGNVHVNGTLSKSAGTFKIDHPLDPENKYLVHSFVESPDMMNVYNGNITTDGSGIAVVTLPEYFEASNIDFRYQLTVIGVFANVIIKEKIKNNQFVIETSQPNIEVSWLVTGIRNDAYAQKHRIISEVDKAESDKGKYLNPEVLGHPKSEGIHYHEISDFDEDRK